jgi:hypothetical protein
VRCEGETNSLSHYVGPLPTTISLYSLYSLYSLSLTMWTPCQQPSIYTHRHILTSAHPDIHTFTPLHTLMPCCMPAVPLHHHPHSKHRGAGAALGSRVWWRAISR